MRPPDTAAGGGVATLRELFAGKDGQRSGKLIPRCAAYRGRDEPIFHP